jgi:serine/threonine-protein kinase
VDAYQAVLQGNYYARRSTKEDFAKAIEFYERAIALDPGYALAHANLAEALISYRGIYGSIPESDSLRTRARAASATAMKLAPGLAQAHGARALELQMLDLRLEDAEKEYRRAAELAPNDAAVMVKLGDLQLDLGRTGPALAAFERAIALDPLLLRAHFRRGYALDLLGRSDEAASALEKAIEVEPQAALQRASLAIVKIHQGDTAAAVKVAQEEPDPFWRQWALAVALFAHGDRKAADAQLEAMIRDTADIAAFQIAEVYAARQDPDTVFHWLDHALETHDPGTTQLFSSSLLARYRDDPRYAAIARKVGLDPANAPAPPKIAIRAQ